MIKLYISVKQKYILLFYFNTWGARFHHQTITRPSLHKF